MKLAAPEIGSERELVALALALGAREVPGWSPAEEALAAHLPTLGPSAVAAARACIARGGDPLGEALCRLRSPEVRRPQGATYTPPEIVAAMLRWAAAEGRPARVVDPGAGSGRFLVRAGRTFPRARLVGVEIDPAAAILARASLAAAGHSGRAEVILADYRDARLPRVSGRTLFAGNPPYVRHHLLGERWKRWLTETAAARGLAASQLAGLHVHFFLATLDHARPGDLGVFITAAEWLDVNYGRIVRDLLMGPLGGRALHVIEPTAAPFPDAATTATIACFEIGARPPTLRVRRVADLADLGALEGGRPVSRERLRSAARWTPLTRPARRRPPGLIELGELCRVHRGQVTGANRIWIAGPQAADLPGQVLFPTVTKARELFAAGAVLSDAGTLRRVIDLPADLDTLLPDARRRVERFLGWARAQGGDLGFIARSRRAWWSVGLREPAPILATYMARRPPAFVRNLARARHINIAHGLYPRSPLSERALSALARFLSRSASQADGRTYAGGLTKFEPREMERLLVPEPEALDRLEPVAVPA